MSPIYSSLDAVSMGVYSALNVAAVTTLATGGVGDDIAQNAGFPFVLFEVIHEKPIGGFGTKPGVIGQLPQIDLLVHVFAQGESFVAAQGVMNQVVAALTNVPPVTGYSSWAIFHDETINVGDQIVAGLKVKELVARFRIFVELL